MALGGLLSRLAGSFGFGGGNQQAGYGGDQFTMGQLQKPAHYSGMNTTMGQLEKPVPLYGGMETTMGQLQKPAHYSGMNTTMGQLRNPMNTQIGGDMGNNQGYDDLMGGQGSIRQLGPATPNQGYDDLMGGQGGFAENPFSKVGDGNAWDAYNQQRSNVGSMTTGGGGGQKFSGAYAAPSWGGKAGYGGAGGPGVIERAGSMMDPSKGGWSAYNAPSWGGKNGYGGKGGAGVIERAGSMMDPSLGGKGGFSMTKGAGMASNIGDIARRFKPMSKGGYSIGEMFKPGGMTNKLLGKGGKAGAAIAGAPAWAMPAAAAATFGVKHLMKRSKQKKHQKQQNAQRDQIKNAAANGQYVTGNLGNLSGPRNY